MPIRKILIPFLLVPLLLALPAAALADKTDIVILTNGDKVTGEIKKLEAGVLEFSTDSMGTVNIEWRFIQQIISDKTQTVETTDGERWTGKLRKPEEGEGIDLLMEDFDIILEPEQVVSVWPVEANVWDKMELDVAVGLDYAKATDITSFYLSSDFSYRTEARFTEVTARSDLTRQSAGDEQTRNQLRGTHYYMLPEKRFRAFFGTIDSNDALGINLRVSAGAGLGRYFIKTNNVWFSGLAGLLVTEENPDEGDSELNIESIVNVNYRLFRFIDPERSLTTTLSVFPSLTDLGRWRSDFRTTFKLEFLSDLFWSMEAYHSYDSDPLDLAAEKSDYGIISSVGWSY
jgi:hypothetical protein